jgi:hypothetical protein
MWPHESCRYCSTFLGPAVSRSCDVGICATCADMILDDPRASKRDKDRATLSLMKRTRPIPQELQKYMPT